MPSPNAASLGKYGDIPVSYNTGVPSIGIPIHTLTEGGLSLPISLSYHAGGMKVGEPCSWVGLGWSLNAGGMISRTVQGRADESFNGYFSIGKSVGLTLDAKCISKNGLENNNPDNSQINTNLNNDLANGEADGEPDIFSFSVGGYNGKFYIEASQNYGDGKVVMIPQQDVKITFNVLPLTTVNVKALYKFTIQTPDGTKYEFGDIGVGSSAIEITEPFDKFAARYASGWYLKRITSADGLSSITLNYAEEIYQYGAKSMAISQNQLPVPSGGYAQSVINILSYRLSSIVTTNETVNFIAGADRQDVTPVVARTDLQGGMNAKKLVAIEILNGDKCKRYELNQNYFEDTSPTKSGQYTDKRLKLNSVQEKSCGTATPVIEIPPHIFMYYTPTTGDANYLPNRLSSAIDHWGYFNDATGNPAKFSNIPYTSLQYSAAGLPFMARQGSSNRETNEEAMKLGTIRQVTYPTGGSTIFEYEANTYWDTQGRKVWADQAYSMFHGGSSGLGDCSVGSNTAEPFAPSVNLNPYSSFSISFATQVEMDELYYKWETAHPNFSGCNTGENIAIVSIFSGNSQTPLKTMWMTGGENQFKTEKGRLSDILPHIPHIPYRFEIRGRNVGSRFFLQKEVVIEKNQNKKIGGLRIKKITTHDGINAVNNIVKTYTYDKLETATGLTKSTGVLYQKPIYGYVYKGILGGDCGGGSNSYNEIPFFFENAVVPLSTFEGNHVNYNSVKENYVANGVTQYYTTYDYNNELIEPFKGIPIVPIQPRIGSGELITKTQWSNTGANVASETYTPYADVYQTGINTFIKFNTYYQGFDNNTGAGTAPISFWSAYKIRTRPQRLSQVTSVKDNITTTTSYTYTSGLLPKKSESVTNSNGTATTTNYFYPSEFGTIYTALMTRNMIFPVQTQTITGSATKWTQVEYNALAQPTYLKECLNNANPNLPSNWITRLYIESYTANGMPQKIWRNNALAYEQYTWNNKLLTRKELISPTSGTLTWDLAYLPGTSLVNQVTDENRLVKKYTYDNLMRLSIVQDRMKSNGSDVQATTNYLYQYNAASVGSFVQTSTSFAGGSAPLISRQIMDGLGRTKESIRIGYTPNNQNLKSLVTYDAQGRVDLSYQPYESDNTLLDATPTAGTLAVQTVYEKSPLSRPIQQIAEDGKSVTTQYLSNTSATIRKFSLVSNGDGTNVVTPSGTYATGTLYQTFILNENGTVVNDNITGSTAIFKDKLGQVILTRKQVKAANGYYDLVDTYNVYDDYGKLVMVIPPGATSAVSATDTINKALVFQYNYDNRNRLIKKKVPNADWVNFYYNDRDQLILTQDGNMRPPQYGGATNRYLATIYDDLGRVKKTGFVTATPVLGQNNTVTESQITELMTETRYYTDPTDATKARTWVKHQAAKVIAPTGITTNRNFVWSYIERRVGYEYTGNPIWTGKQHILKSGMPERPILDADTYGVDWSVSAYNGLQKPTLTVRNLFTGTAQTEVRTYETYAYDNGQRLTNVKHTFALNGAGVAVPTFNLSNFTYNYKDQLTLKKIANVNSKYLQSIDYAYNQRGWLTNIGSVNETGHDYPIFNADTDATAINSTAYPAIFPFPAAISGDDNPDLFTETISYDSPNTNIPGATSTAQWNGNISQVVWQIAGREKQVYSFKYDNLERLTEANYADIHNSTFASHGWSSLYQGDNKYQEKVSYDVRGNIQSVQRNGLTNTQFSVARVSGYFGQIDNLTYTYDPTDKNKLLKVADAADLGKGFTSINNTATTHYAYDMNGNLIADANKGITNITYNYLNLPMVITFTSNRSIKFVYDATGAKLQKIVNDNVNPATTQHYVNGIEYNGNTLERIPHTEGEIVKNATGNYIYQYALKDHLGNRRVTFVGNTTALGTVAASDIKQVNHYYPFGMNMEGPAYSFSGVNKMQYNEKELNTDFGLNWNDYGARFYDASRLQFTSVDLLADAYAFQSPFAYAANNPVKYRDFMGMGPESADGMTNEQWMSSSNPANHRTVAAGASYNSSALGQANYEKLRGEAEYAASHYGEKRPVTGDDILQTITTILFTDVYVNGELLSRTVEGCGCGGEGQPPCPPESTNSIGTNVYNGLKYAAQNAAWVFGTTASKTDDVFYDGAGKAALNGDYTMAALMLATSRLPGGRTITGWVARKEFQALESVIQKKVVAAIRKGIVGPTGENGILIVKSTEELFKKGYTHKVKILGVGGAGDVRIYGKELGNGHIFFDHVTGH